jgi:hypothetical protein
VAQTTLNSTQQTPLQAGNGISIENNIITNTLPDKEVMLIGTNGVKIQGSYPTFVIEGDGIFTPYQPGDGISIQNNTITNTKPDRTLLLSGANGIQITGFYPEYTIGLLNTATSLNIYDSTKILIKGAKNILNYPVECDSSFNIPGAKML